MSTSVLSVMNQEKFFSDEELELAQLLKAFGMEWTPRVGCFVLDQSELIEVPSPFQERVYFILDMKHFLRRAASIEELKERVCWLPTWEQARKLLRDLGVPDSAVNQRLTESRAIVDGTERLELYRMLEESITGGDFF